MLLLKASRYRSEIDGLRALAVLPVVLFHLGLGFPGGFTGVDVFFVISGFLICGIILRESDDGRFSMLRFYERRVRRILPAFFVVIFAALVLSVLVLYPHDLDLMGHHLSYISLFASNVELSFLEDGYWASGAESFPLLHTWSLAVEEQFYFVMPVILLVLHRWLKKHLFSSLLFLFFVSLGYCIYVTQVAPQRAFYLLPSRAWEMLMGGLVYLLIQRDCPWEKSPKVGQIIGGLGLLLMIISYFTLTGEMAFPGYTALFPTLGTALFIYSNSWGTNWTGRFLAWSPFVFIGKISYSLYLWHWPLIVFLKAYRDPVEITLSDKIALFVVSFVVSVLSWRFVEQPFRHPAKRHSALKAIVTACILLVLMFGVSLVIRKYNGFTIRTSWIAGDVVYRIKGEQEALGLRGYPKIFDAAELFDVGGYQVGLKDGQLPRVVVLGDSHAGMYGPVLSDLTLEHDVFTSFFTQSGTKPLFDEVTLAEDERIFNYIEEWQPVRIVLIMRMDHLIDEIEMDPVYIERWVSSMRRLSENCGELCFVLQTPKSVSYDMRDAPEKQMFQLIQLLTNKGETELPMFVREPDISRQSRDRILMWVDGLGLPNIRLLDPALFMLKGRDVLITHQGRLLYLDDDHLSNFGAELSMHMFREVFEEIRVKEALVSEVMVVDGELQEVNLL